MGVRRDLSKEELLAAMAKTNSIKGVSRYLECSNWLVQKWMKFYTDDATGLSLNQLHANKDGRGVAKGWAFYHMKRETYKSKTPVENIIKGKIDICNFTLENIKNKFISEGYLIEKCSECGFCDSRVLDDKIPLVFHFKDNNKKNFQPDNVTLLCYNCYFLHGYEIFDKKTLKEMESFEFENVKLDKMKKTFKVDDYHLERLKELGLDGKEGENDESNIVSRNE